jgi:hypothetical protein
MDVKLISEKRMLRKICQSVTSFISCTIIRYYQIKVYVMGGIYTTYGRDETCRKLKGKRSVGRHA